MRRYVIKGSARKWHYGQRLHCAAQTGRTHAAPTSIAEALKKPLANGGTGRFDRSLAQRFGPDRGIESRAAEPRRGMPGRSSMTCCVRKCTGRRADAERRLQPSGESRVGVWRGGVRLGIAVAAPFVRRCLSGSAVAPFPHPPHRTGHADLPHPALGQDLTPSSTARRAQAGSDVRARSARRGARVDSSRPA
jgi:hypothetical protein